MTLHDFRSPWAGDGEGDLRGIAPRLFYRPATDDVTLQHVFTNVENKVTDSVIDCVINFVASVFSLI